MFSISVVAQGNNRTFFTMAQITRNKYSRIRDELIQAIRAGEFVSGSALPGERELAHRFGVSHMTARRAVTDLVEANLLERRERSGTYVRGSAAQRLATTTLNVVCAPYENSISRTFLRLGAREAEKRGWTFNAVHLNRGDEKQIIRSIESGEPTLVLSDESNYLVQVLGEAMQKAGGKTVLVSNRLDSMGVPSVLADDAQAIRLATQHLLEHGHRRVALVCNHPQHPIERIQIAAWQSLMAAHATPEEIGKWLVVVDTPRFECPTRFTGEKLRRVLATRLRDVTALVCLEDEMTLGVLQACREIGREVPSQMSLVNAGDSSSMESAHPPVTCVDVNLEQHVEFAMQLLEAALKSDLGPLDRLRIVEPQLLERNSVMAAP